MCCADGHGPGSRPTDTDFLRKRKQKKVEDFS